MDSRYKPAKNITIVSIITDERVIELNKRITIGKCNGKIVTANQSLNAWTKVK